MQRIHLINQICDLLTYGLFVSSIASEYFSEACEKYEAALS